MIYSEIIIISEIIKHILLANTFGAGDSKYL